MTGTEFDFIVIGAGPGGYSAAIRAAQLGMKTAVVERDRLGGICLNWGCIPTKALLRTSEVYRLMQEADSFGLGTDEVGFDLVKIVARSRAIAERLSNGVAYLMKKNDIAVIKGTATLEGAARIALTGESGEALPSLSAKHIIIATGARAKTLPGLEPDGKSVWTYKEAMVPESFPRSLLIVGSGAIGMEFASFYRALGAEVTVVEMLDRILPAEDEEISHVAHKAFKKRGITIRTGTTVERMVTGVDGVTVTLKSENGATAEGTVERVLLAIGVTGNVEELGLEEQGIVIRRGHIVVDDWCCTGVPRFYAIGDVVGPPRLAHKAMHEGVMCVEKIANLDGVHPLDRTNIPACTYSAPQIASLGLTETAAQEAGYDVKVGRYPFSANGKAIAMDETEGMIKTIFDAKSGALLGAHMIGAEVTELIPGFAIGKTLETTEAELIATVFPHPTLSEMMHESVLDAFGRARHI